MWRLTCREVLIDGPVVHLQSGVAPIPGEAHHVVLSIVHRDTSFLHTDVDDPNVEGDTDFALLLRRQKQVNFQQPFSTAWI